MGNTKIRCGFIGEIGISADVSEQSVRMLSAASIAQKETGASILIHQTGLGHVAGTLFKIITDNDRIFFIRKQIEKGDLHRILISHDVAYKFMLRQYSGPGYAHIPKRVVRFMQDVGYDKEWLIR